LDKERGTFAAARPLHMKLSPRPNVFASGVE
jgi:hypothetical protein